MCTCASQTARAELHAGALDTTAAAAYLGGIAVRTLANWRARGEGPSYVRVGTRIAYRIEDLDSWLLARREVVSR